MKITLDEHGILMPDTAVEHFVKDAVLNQRDVHTAQELVVLGLRAELNDIPVDKRPQIEWVFYGKEVHFDKDMRSFDAHQDSRTSIGEGFLCRLILDEPKKV